MCFMLMLTCQLKSQSPKAEFRGLKKAKINKQKMKSKFDTMLVISLFFFLVNAVKIFLMH